MFGLIGILKKRNLFLKRYLIHIVVLLFVQLFWLNGSSLASTWVDVMAAQMACSASYPACTCDIVDTSSGGTLSYRIDKWCMPHTVKYSHYHYTMLSSYVYTSPGFYVYQTVDGPSCDGTVFKAIDQWAWVPYGAQYKWGANCTLYAEYCDGQGTVSSSCNGYAANFTMATSDFDLMGTCGATCTQTVTTYASFTNVQPCDTSVDPCCINPDPCCGSGDPCCGNPDPCCKKPDDPCCVDPACCGDICCQLNNQAGHGGS